VATKAATKPAEFGNKCCGPAAQLSPKSGRESKNVSKRERAASGDMRPAAGRQHVAGGDLETHAHTRSSGAHARADTSRKSDKPKTKNTQSVACGQAARLDVTNDAIPRFAIGDLLLEI